MNDERLCPSCRKPLAADVPMGLCPECLIQAGFPTGAPSGAGSSAPSGFVPPTVGEMAGLFPQLEIIGLIGKGGMGAVYQARQKQLNRFVALKILPPGAGGPAFAERFAREARALAQLNHPGIVTLHEFGQAGGMPYFLMEFVDGVNLRQLLHNSRVSPREALAIVPQICDALQFAHDHGIVHRDIKPENILIDRRGRVKVADFGLAKIAGGGLEPAMGQNDSAGTPALTETGKIMGTPSYMAPEQLATPADVDHRADIYALGVVFYQMLTGELPGKQIQPPSRKVQMDARLDEIVLRALEQKPELRFQQAGDLKTSVEIIAASADAIPSAGPAGATPAEKTGVAPAGVADAFPPRQLFPPLPVFVASYFGFLTWITVSVLSMPARVASHFDLEGRANSWMDRSHYLWFIGLLPLLFPGLAWLAGRLARTLPPRFVNIPHRDYWLAPERRAVVSSFLQNRMLWFSCLMTGFIAGLHLVVLAANRDAESHLSSGGLLLLVIAFLIAVLVWAVSLVMRLSDVDKPLGPVAGAKSGGGLHTTGPASPFMSPEAREIAAHMTGAEKLAARNFDVCFVIWNSATFFLPFAFIWFIPIPVPLNWILASATLFAGLAVYPLWWKKQAKLLCATSWAKEQGIKPDSVRISPLGSTVLILVGVVFLAVVSAFWWQVYRPEGVWLPSLSAASILSPRGATLRVTEVSQHARIVLVRIACDAIPDAGGLYPVYSGPLFELSDPLPSGVTNVDCLVTTGPHSTGKVISGSDLLTGKPDYLIGFVLPDEQAAAAVVNQVTKLNLGKTHALNSPLFILQRLLGKDAAGKPVVENVYGWVDLRPKGIRIK